MKTIGLQSLAFVAASVLALAGCERPPVDTVQHGYRGTGMVHVENPRAFEAKVAANQVPEAMPLAPKDAPNVKTIYKNVKVVGDLNVAEFTRLMVAMTTWVAPEQGCNYCHEVGNFESDKLYTKVVARRMLEMTRHINADDKNHVAGTGVTCYTCHRGQPVPNTIWFADTPPANVSSYMGNKAGQNAPSKVVGLTSLPNDPFDPYLRDATDIRVVALTALPQGTAHTMKETEATYGLMMHMSKSLGVNCTFCHNTRSFATWETSSPQRTTAYYGIRMVRDLNANFLDPLKDVFPPERLGPSGDSPKINCGTCHQGAYKPLMGVSMLKDYPELAAASAVPAPAEAPAAPAAAPAPPK
jgi:photosynthetic reaction center cytochrome c subunit